MSFGLTYDQLIPVVGPVRAGIVSYDGSNPAHRMLLREALPHFLGSLGAVHGEAFPMHKLQAVIDVVDAKEIEVDFFLVALDTCSPIKLAGLATGAPTFGVEWDKNNKLKIYPVKHGEDLCVDKDMAKLFREYTRNHANPNGIGAGTWFMREQIRRSVSNPDWVFAGRDNEHSPNNPPIMGLMDKFGAIRGTEADSAVLQIDALPHDMKKRWGVNNVITEDLPAYANGLGVCPNNFMTRWSSENGEQQIAVIYTKIPSTFGTGPVAWTKIKSNGNLPDSEMLQEVLASLLRAGCKEISSPERAWGLPKTRLSHVFGAPMPVMHIHTSREPQIVDSLLQMKADYRKFGHEDAMLSGVINPRNAPNSEKLFGYRLPEATEVQGIDPERDANKPIFSIGDEPEIICRSKAVPIRPDNAKARDKENHRSYVAA